MSQWLLPTAPAVGFQAGESSTVAVEAAGLEATAEEEAEVRNQAFKKGCDKEAIKGGRHDAMKAFRKVDKEAVMTARRGAAFTEFGAEADAAQQPVQHGAAMTQEKVDYHAHTQQEEAVNVAIHSDNGCSHG